MSNIANSADFARALSRRSVLGAVTAGAGVALLGTAEASTSSAACGAKFDAKIARTWARDTWKSMAAMTFSNGLTADNMEGSLAASSRSRYTSPTNIGAYMWSAVAARDLGIISPSECTKRIAVTLKTLAGMQKHTPSGMYANWYDPQTGSMITSWPGTGAPVVPFYSSVDNAWLGAALYLVRNAVPGVHKQADALWRSMRWDMFFDAKASRPGGLVHGGFYTSNPGTVNTAVFTGNHIGSGSDVWYTNHHYDTVVSETRITTYLGFIRGQIPASNYYALWRTFPSSCDWSWQESQPEGVTRTYFGIDVYEGAYPYRGMKVVPGWGGSMFEELMPNVFVPEEVWAPKSWGRNHSLHVRAQKEHGLNEAKYGYWGFSPASDPTVAGGYREYGVDQLGLNPDGYLSDVEKTNVDAGFGTCRPATNAHPTFGDGVVTPHAAALALMHDRQGAYENLRKIQTQLHAYGPGGFYDAVAVRSGKIARRYLALDQGMMMGVFANVLANNSMRRAFSTREAERAIRPIIGVEEFGAAG